MILHHDNVSITGSDGIGLASAWSRSKSEPSHRRRIAAIMFELRYAWQRAWRGYDDEEVFDLGYRFAARMPYLLKDFKQHNDCLFREPEKGMYTAEETDQIIDDMIFYFLNCSETAVYQRMYGVGIAEDTFNRDRCLAAAVEAKRCRSEVMRLYSKWCVQLWF